MRTTRVSTSPDHRTELDAELKEFKLGRLRVRRHPTEAVTAGAVDKVDRPLPACETRQQQTSHLQSEIPFDDVVVFPTGTAGNVKSEALQ